MTDATTGSRLGGGGLSSAAELIDEALRSASDPCVVIVQDSFEADVRFANNTTTTNGIRRERGVVVASFHDTAAGSATGMASGVASASGGVDVAELVARAEAEARSAAEPADDAAQLVGPSALDEGVDEPPEETSLTSFTSLLAMLGEAFSESEATDRLLSGFISHEQTTTYLASSTGLRRRHVQPTGSFQLVGRSSDGTRSTWTGTAFEAPAEIDFESIYTRVKERLEWATRKVDLSAGRYEVVMPGDAVADLVSWLHRSMSGRDAEDGGSVFSGKDGATRVGEQLTPLPFELGCDPGAPGLSTAPFLFTMASGRDVSVFDNGLPLEPVNMIEGGRLRRLIYHRAGAVRSGVPFTQAGRNSLCSLPGATASLEDLVARTERGLLLTCLWYIREVDPATLLLTGLTRDGVYLIENGEVSGAVNNFRFNESPIDVLAKTIEAGPSARCLSREWHEWAPRTSMPPIRVADFNMSSVSPAN